MILSLCVAGPSATEYTVFTSWAQVVLNPEVLEPSPLGRAPLESEASDKGGPPVLTGALQEGRHSHLQHMSCLCSAGLV